jgi:hypothetical protein
MEHMRRSPAAAAIKPKKLDFGSEAVDDDAAASAAGIEADAMENANAAAENKAPPAPAVKASVFFGGFGGGGFGGIFGGGGKAAKTATTTADKGGEHDRVSLSNAAALADHAPGAGAADEETDVEAFFQPRDDEDEERAFTSSSAVMNAAHRAINAADESAFGSLQSFGESGDWSAFVPAKRPEPDGASGTLSPRGKKKELPPVRTAGAGGRLQPPDDEARRRLLLLQSTALVGPDFLSRGVQNLWPDDALGAFAAVAPQQVAPPHGLPPVAAARLGAGAGSLRERHRAAAAAVASSRGGGGGQSSTAAAAAAVSLEMERRELALLARLERIGTGGGGLNVNSSSPPATPSAAAADANANAAKSHQMLMGLMYGGGGGGRAAYSFERRPLVSPVRVNQ